MNQIGRRIFYDKSTGNVIHDTGERSGDVIETTIDHDFATYVVLAERIRSTVGVIQLDYGQFGEDFASAKSYRINTTMGILEFDFTPAETLSTYKEQKISELNRRCNEGILAGFTSNALGVDNFYDFDYDSQINLGGMLNAITANIHTTDVIWKASGVPQNHSIEQFKVVFGDGLNHKNEKITRYWTLKSQVEASETDVEVAAIVW